MSLQHRYFCKFSASSMFSSDAPQFSAHGGTGGTPWGPGAASAESCTHLAKRDHCLHPQIAERRWLPNVGIAWNVRNTDRYYFTTVASNICLSIFCYHLVLSKTVRMLFVLKPLLYVNEPVKHMQNLTFQKNRISSYILNDFVIWNIYIWSTRSGTYYGRFENYILLVKISLHFIRSVLMKIIIR